MKNSEELKEVLFPFEKIRDEQDKLIKAVANSIENKRHLVVHAPTGLGKTAASLGPCLKYALSNKKAIFFLISRHTQHIIAIETLKEIKEKFNIEFSMSDMIGKKHMCIFPAIDKIPSGEFLEFCQQMRDENKCEFYVNFRKDNKISVKARTAAAELSRSINHTEKVIETCQDEKICPYEIASLIGKDAQVIIGDYYYVFNPNVRNSFFRRIGKDLGDTIIIVDEAHNLPERLRNLMSIHVSSFIMKRALQEAKKYHFQHIMGYLVGIQNILNELSSKVTQEKVIGKDDFMKEVKKLGDYDTIIEEMEIAASLIRDMQRYSFVNSVMKFLEAWAGNDEGFVRIISVGKNYEEPYVRLEYNCLDPSLVTKEVIDNAHSVICMSGTLTPVDMYADLLGFDERTDKAEFTSPFPQKNVKRMILPDITTKYTRRNEAEFNKTAKICSEISDAVPGNVAFFFPSYSLRDTIAKKFKDTAGKKIYFEDPKMNKARRQQMLENYKEESKKNSGRGAVLFAAATGSFGEGIDLPGDYLKAVVIVGLPLSPPDVETKALIEYYNKKYGKGMDYAYIFPAITKCMQGAGRCIRSETDKGVIIFLDERFAWPQYSRCFPPDYNLKITRNYSEEIKKFFLPQS